MHCIITFCHDLIIMWILFFLFIFLSLLLWLAELLLLGDGVRGGGQPETGHRRVWLYHNSICQVFGIHLFRCHFYFPFSPVCWASKTMTKMMMIYYCLFHSELSPERYWKGAGIPGGARACVYVCVCVGGEGREEYT